MFNKGKIYLDNASTTPIDKRVIKIISSLERDFFANASSIHTSGVKVRDIIEEMRGKIAKGINAHNDEIIFTGSGTESDALAILGVISYITQHITHNKDFLPHIVTSQIEHPAVLENCKFLENRGEIEVTYVGVDKNGIINLEELKESLKDNTILVSIMYANNEIGSIQPIEEIAKIIRHFRKGKSAPQGIASGSLETKPFPADFPVFHTDACQAMNYLYTENIEKLGVDMMSFNGSKIYGPKGIGILYKKRNVELSPIYAGGGQEFGLRSGTEDVASIAGFSLAFEITNKIKNKESERLTKLRIYAIEKLMSINIKPYKIILNGDKEKRLPNNINISIKGISSELLVIELDAKGIEVSSKSACKSSDDEGSYVLKAINGNDEKVDGEVGSLRITLGRFTTKDHIDKLIFVLTKILEKYKDWK